MVNVRVENRRICGSEDDRKRGFDGMLKAFNKICKDQGVVAECKRRAYYEKPSEKRRRKKIDQQYEFQKIKNKENSLRS